METTVIVDFPKPVYQRLQRQAEVFELPLNDIVVQTVRNGLPLWRDTIPPSFEAELSKLDYSNIAQQQVAERSRFRCGYCLVREDMIGERLQVDHITPQIADGKTSEENLCLTCSACNRFKGFQTRAHDPVTGQRVRLFNPNEQNWLEHFRWSDDGILIIGRTSCGRATIAALTLNNSHKILARKFWIKFNEHPPQS